MKLNKVLMLTVLALVSSTQAKVAVVEKAAVALKKETPKAKKTLVECVKAAKCRNTLEKHLRDNGHGKIADAFKDVRTKFQAMRAYMSLDATTKAQVKQVVENHQDHFQKILGL